MVQTNWWAYPTNYTDSVNNITNRSVDGVGSFFGNYPSSIIPGYGLGMVVIMWLVFFSLSAASGVRKAMMASSFITGVISVWLWRIGMIDPWIIFLMVVLTVVGAIGSKEENI